MGRYMKDRSEKADDAAYIRSQRLAIDNMEHSAVRDSEFLASS
jgi:hypothetical protein